MKRILAYGAFGLLVYVVILAASFPAARAYRLLEPRLGHLQLYDLEGSMWHGRAAVAQVGKYRLSPVSWQYRPLGLLGGRMDVKLDLRRGPAHASGVVGMYRDGRLRLSDTRITLPAVEISRAVGLPFVELGGDFLAHIDSLRVGTSHRLTALNGKVVWNDARVVKPQAFQPGGVEADFTTAADGVIKGVLHDTGGALQLNGLITIKPDGSYKFNAQLAARDNSQPGLSRLLDTLGRQAGGKVSLSYSGTLPKL